MLIFVDKPSHYFTGIWRDEKDGNGQS